MSARRRLQLLTLALRFLVGGVFVYAGCEKLMHPERFASAIAEYQILTSSFTIRAASYALPSIEILCGVGLFYKRTTSISAAVIAGLLLIFIAAIVSAAVRGLDITCGCFGESVLEGNAGFMRLAEDVVLLAVTLFLFFARTEKMESHPS